MTKHSAATGPVVPARWRDYLYPIAVAVILLLAGYGLIADEQTALWVALVAGLLGNGTATAYRPSKTLPHVPNE